MLFEWERVKEEVIAEVSRLHPEISEEAVRKVVACMDVRIRGLIIEVSYRALDGRRDHV